MSSFASRLQQLQECYARLSEAAPPPFKAADRAKAGMAALPKPKAVGGSALPKLKLRARVKPLPASNIHSKFDTSVTDSVDRLQDLINRLAEHK